MVSETVSIPAEISLSATSPRVSSPRRCSKPCPRRIGQDRRAPAHRHHRRRTGRGSRRRWHARPSCGPRTRHVAAGLTISRSAASTPAAEVKITPAKRAGRQGWGQDLECHQRGQDRRTRVPKRGRQRRGESARLGHGPGQQHGHGGQGSGLSRHAHGVTCRRTLHATAAMDQTLTLLGIESSCDDTAAAVVRLCRGGRRRSCPRRCRGRPRCMRISAAWCPRSPPAPMPNGWMAWWSDALAAGRGDAGRDLDAHRGDRRAGADRRRAVGRDAGRGLAAATGLPLVGGEPSGGPCADAAADGWAGFPYLMLLVSGGHCQFLLVEGADRVSPPGRHDRRRPGRGVRQDGEASGPAATRRPGGRGRGGAGRSDALRAFRVRCWTARAATCPSPA